MPEPGPPLPGPFRLCVTTKGKRPPKLSESKKSALPAEDASYPPGQQPSMYSCADPMDRHLSIVRRRDMTGRQIATATRGRRWLIPLRRPLFSRKLMFILQIVANPKRLQTSPVRLRVWENCGKPGGKLWWLLVPWVTKSSLYLTSCLPAGTQ